MMMYTAIWMMPEEDHYGGWPKSGEIDIMESTGKPLQAVLSNLLVVHTREN